MKKFIKNLLILIILLLCHGCIGSTIFNKKVHDKHNFLHTPSLHSIPERPPETNYKEIEKTKKKLQEDYNKAPYK